MQSWVSKTDAGLILISDSFNHHKIRSHSAKPLIPKFQYSAAFMHGDPAKAELIWAKQPDFQS